MVHDTKQYTQAELFMDEGAHLYHNLCMNDSGDRNQ